MDLQELSRWQYQKARYWRRGFFGLQAGAYGAGLITSLTHSIPHYAPLVVALMLLAAEFFLWLHETARGEAERIRRLMDLDDAFGWALSPHEIADLSARNGPIDRGSRERYFASGITPGPRRAVENVREAAWWTRHLAQTCYRIAFSTFIILLGGSLLFLLIEITRASDLATLNDVAEIVIASLLLISSFGLFRLYLGFDKLSNGLRVIENEANRLLGTLELQEIDAVKLCFEYYITRGEAPMLFGWIYEGIIIKGVNIYPGRKAALNAAWKSAYGEPQ